MSEDYLGTFFLDEDGNQLGSADGIIPIPLVEDMIITLHGHDGTFEVKSWNYHHGHPDERGGLRIILRKKGQFVGFGTVG